MLTNHAKVFGFVKNVEKKYRRTIYYSGLIFLSISLYFTRTDLQNAKIQISELKQTNTFLIKNMILYNRNYEPFPYPVWQKKKDGKRFVMQYVNPVYVEKFGHLFENNQYEIIGKTNFEMFPLEDAQQYFEHDVAVAVFGEKLETLEYTKDSLGNRLQLDVVKWRDIKDNKDTLVYGMVKAIKKLK